MSDGLLNYLSVKPKLMSIGGMTNFLIVTLGVMQAELKLSVIDHQGSR